MAGELYALSSALVEYIATDPTVASMVRGKEDKLVSQCVVNESAAHSLDVMLDCTLAADAPSGK